VRQLDDNLPSEQSLAAVRHAEAYGTVSIAPKD